MILLAFTKWKCSLIMFVSCGCKFSKQSMHSVCWFSRMNLPSKKILFYSVTNIRKRKKTYINIGNILFVWKRNVYQSNQSSVVLLDRQEPNHSPLPLPWMRYYWYIHHFTQHLSIFYTKVFGAMVHSMFMEPWCIQGLWHHGIFKVYDTMVVLRFMADWIQDFRRKFCFIGLVCFVGWTWIAA